MWIKAGKLEGILKMEKEEIKGRGRNDNRTHEMLTWKHLGGKVEGGRTLE